MAEKRKMKKSPTAKKFTRMEEMPLKEKMLEDIAMMDRRGHTQFQIAHKVGLSQPMVGMYLKRIWDNYGSQAVLEVHKGVAEKIAQYREIREQAWNEWERSKNPNKKVIVEKAQRARAFAKKDGDARDDVKEFKKSLEKVRVTISREGRLGNVGYLNIIFQTLESERELLGLVVSAEEKKDEDLKQPIDWNRLYIKPTAMIEDDAVEKEIRDAATINQKEKVE